MRDGIAIRCRKSAGAASDGFVRAAVAWLAGPPQGQALGVICACTEQELGKKNREKSTVIVWPASMITMLPVVPELSNVWSVPWLPAGTAWLICPGPV